MGSETLRLEAVRCGLSRSARKVRELAACKAQGFGLRTVLDQLDRVMAQEQNAACRAALRFSYLLLRDGFIVEHEDDGFVRVTVAGTHSVVGERFAASDVERRGLSRLIADLQAEALRIGIRTSECGAMPDLTAS